MSVTGGGHRQAAFLRISERVFVVTTQRGGGIEDFDGVDRQRFENRKANAGSKQVIGMGRNRQSAVLMDQLTNFERRPAFEFCGTGQSRANAEKMTVASGDLGSWDDEEIIDRLPILAHQPLLQKIGNRFTGVVVGDGEPMQTFRPRRGDNFFRARDAVSREEGMRVQVDIERHGLNANLEVSKWKALVSRSGRWCAKRSGAVAKVLFCARGGSRKDGMVSRSSIANSFCSRPGFMSNRRRCGMQGYICRSKMMG